MQPRRIPRTVRTLLSVADSGAPRRRSPTKGENMDAWIREKLAGWTATCGLVIVIVMVVALWRHASFHRPLSFLLLLLVAVLIVIVANRVRRSIDLLTPPRHGVGYPSAEKPSYIKDSHSAPSGRSSPRSDSAASATRGAEASPLSARGAAVSSHGQGTDRPAAAHPTPPDNYATIDARASSSSASSTRASPFLGASTPWVRRSSTWCSPTWPRSTRMRRSR